jgi:hypothetical protein
MFLICLIFSSIYLSREDEDDEENIPHYFNVTYNPPPELFVAHGRVWRDEGDIVTQQPNVNPYTLPPKLKWSQLLVENEAAREFDFLRLMFPMRFLIDVIIPLTNAKLIQLQQSILMPDEFILFLGITLSMALQPIRGGIDARRQW